MITLQDLSDTSVSVATAPAFVPELPTTNWFAAVAVAELPKTTHPENPAVDAAVPTIVLLTPEFPALVLLPIATFEPLVVAPAKD